MRPSSDTTAAQDAQTEARAFLSRCRALVDARLERLVLHGKKERDLADQLFRMRIQKSMGQLEAPAKVRSVRRDLARVKTFLRQKAK